MSDDPHELLHDLGRWVREQEARAEPVVEPVVEPGFEPFPDERADALIERALAAQDAEVVEPAAAVATTSIEPEPPQTGRLLSMAAYLVAAAAAVAATFLAVAPSPEPEDHDRVARHGESSGLAADGPAGPAFASLRIEGGGPLPLHQGKAIPRDSQQICLGRPMQLTLAVAKEGHVDPSEPLELVLEATPPWGSGHRFTYDVARDERLRWVDGGQALVFSGTLEQLAPLTPGSWTVQLSAGAPGTCSLRREGSGCTSMKVRTLEVIAQEGCDARR